MTDEDGAARALALGDAAAWMRVAEDGWACACCGPPGCCVNMVRRARALRREAHIAVKQMVALLERKEMDEEPRKMTRAEAGRLGGQKTRDRYGIDFYRQIGKDGGRLGGSSTRDLYGKEHFARIGAKGGVTPRKTRRNQEET